MNITSFSSFDLTKAWDAMPSFNISKAWDSLPSMSLSSARDWMPNFNHTETMASLANQTEALWNDAASWSSEALNATKDFSSTTVQLLRDYGIQAWEYKKSVGDQISPVDTFVLGVFLTSLVASGIIFDLARRINNIEVQANKPHVTHQHVTMHLSIPRGLNLNQMAEFCKQLVDQIYPRQKVETSIQESHTAKAG